MVYFKDSTFIVCPPKVFEDVEITFGKYENDATFRQQFVLAAETI